MGKEKEHRYQVAVRLPESIWKRYKKWLVDHGYKSINQHLNEVIEKILEEEERKN
jgi:predicted DNA-binding protein